MRFPKHTCACLAVFLFAFFAGACSESIDVGGVQEAFDATASITLKNVSNNSIATTVSSSEIMLSWTSVSGASLYSVERSPNGSDGFAEIATASRGTLSYRDSGLTPATIYFYRLRAAKVFTNRDAVYTPYSNVVSATTQDPLAVPFAPSGLVASASSSQIILTWRDNSNNETWFEIERCVGAGCTNYAPYAQVEAGVTTFTDTNVTAGITYCYRVRACNVSGCSDFSNTFCVAILPPLNLPNAPSGLIATASGNQIVLTWQDNSSNETRFEIERCVGSGCTDYALYAQVGANVGTFTDASATAGLTYCYRVRACNADGCSGYSNTFCAAVPVVTAPAAPSGLLATASATQIVLTWQDNSNNETRFEIERCVGAGCTNYAPYAQVGANVGTYTDTSVAAGTTYCYRVRACNSTGCSGYSNTFCVAVPVLNVPAAPSNLVTTASATQIVLSWQDNSDNEVDFAIWRCEGAGCTNYAPYAQVGANISTFTDTNVVAGHTYCYRVQACGANGCSDYSNTSCASVPAAPALPLAPSGLVATASTTQIVLTWQDNSANETWFEIERCIGAGCTNYAPYAQVGANVGTYTDTSVVAGTTYCYRVRACNTSGCSGYSNTFCVAVPTSGSSLAAPTNLSFEYKQGNILLQWADNSSDEDGFKVERCFGAGCTNFIIVFSMESNSTGVWDKPPTGGLVSYRVKAVKGTESSGYSNVATAGWPNLRVTVPGPNYNTAVLVWDAIPGADHYVIRRGQQCGVCPQEVIATLGAGVTTLTDTGLPPNIFSEFIGHPYRYGVEAFAADNTLLGQQGWFDVTVPAGPLAPPDGMAWKGAVFNANLIQVNWIDMSYAETGFEVERSQAGGPFTRITTTAANAGSYEDRSLPVRDAIYCYRVRAVQGTQAGSYSDTACFIADDPSVLSITSVGSTQITLSWTDNSSQETEIRLLQNGINVTLGPNVTTYTETGLTPGTNYCYYLYTYAGTARGPYSNTICAMTSGL
ncbi:MAG: hypothetical protein V1798_01315 [Pseudomonadota bacterium]